MNHFKETLTNLHIQPIMGDLNDAALITQHAYQADIIFHTATADHLPSVLAVLSGISARSARGKDTIFIHTSGTGVLDDGANGAFKSSIIYHDNNPSQIDSLADSAPHRSVDLAILKARSEAVNQGKAKMAIMTPPLIYGFNPKHERLSIQIPTFTRWAIKHSYASHVGRGLAVESNIHVLDLARGYVTLLHALETSPPSSPFLQNPYFFCETTGDDEPSWKEIAGCVGEGLKAAGKIDDERPREMSDLLYGDAFGDATGATIGLNSRCRAVRLRELGWVPREKDWRRSFLEDELPEILKEEEGRFEGYKGTTA